MTAFVRSQGLPKNRITLAAVSYQSFGVRKALGAIGVETIEIKPDLRLPKPVNRHADMTVCPMRGNDIFVLRGNRKLHDALCGRGFNALYTQNEPTDIYPGDVILNCLLLGNTLYCSKNADGAVTEYAISHGIDICHVNQGYVRCSCCVVDENSVITADKGLAGIFAQNGVDVLLIKPGHIELKGYDTGFIGGCSFKISESEMLFTGGLSSHPSSNEIKSYLNKKGISAVECDNEFLVDIGSAALLMQKGFDS